MDSVSRDASRYAIVDVEVGMNDHRIHDIGGLLSDGAVYHNASKSGLLDFLSNVDYVCGHNIVHHDAKYLFGDEHHHWVIVDTLYMSPLLFPEKPYHRLVKDDKLIDDQMNNPVNDCKKAKDLLLDEISCWKSLPDEKQQIYSSLLKGKREFEGFLDLVNAKGGEDNLADLIKKVYNGKLCENAQLDVLINQSIPL